MANRQETIALFRAETGFDYFRVYCSVTGKPFGFLSASERHGILSLVCESNDDADAAVEDLLIRILASIRPSLRWNKFRAETFAEMRLTHPTEVLAYLVNRMFAPLNSKKMGIDEMLGFYADRIKGYALLEQWGVTDDSNTLTYMLLEIDAKMGLDVESPPFNAHDFFFDAPTMKHRVEMVQAWYANLLIRWEKRLKDEEMSIKWMRHGNVLAKPAFAAAYQESKPLTITAIKRAEKAADQSIFNDALWEVLGSKLDSITHEPKPETPAPVVVPLVRVTNLFARRPA